VGAVSRKEIRLRIAPNGILLTPSHVRNDGGFEGSGSLAR